MTEAKFYRDFPMILELFSQLKQGVRISILDENQNIICLADYLAEIQDYIINNHLYEKAKELILYKDLLQKVYDYCQTDKAVPEAKQMAKECDFIGCCAVLEVLEQWLNDKGQNDNTERAKTYSKDIKLPKELDNDKGKTQQNNDNKQPQQETEREKEYFAKAIQAGLMKKDGENYKWLHNNGLQSSLGYFLKMVFNPKGTAQIHYKRMENLFKVSRLDSAIDRALSVKKPQKWRKEIDVLFDD